MVFKSVSAGEEKGIREYESVITLMNGLINFSSSIVDGTVGRAGDRDLCFRHQAILSRMACVFNSHFYKYILYICEGYNSASKNLLDMAKNI